MLSRVGSVSIQHCRRRQQLLRHAGNLAAVSLAGVGLYTSTSNTKLEGALKFDNVGTTLIVPTMEATARAFRLVSTALLIISDYESAKVAAKIFPDKNPERVRLEKEKEARRQELEDAQIAYTSPKSDEMVANSGKTKQAFVQHQKDAVHLAADQLAEAEEKLGAVGDTKGDIHLKAANRLLNLCRKNGGVYIKIGQHLANLDYIVPPEYITVLSSLFDDTPQSCKYYSTDQSRFLKFLSDFSLPQPILMCAESLRRTWESIRTSSLTSLK